MVKRVELDNVSVRFVLQHQRSRSFQDALVGLLGRRETNHEEFWALQNVSFALRAGETVGIIGENGSGKSTVLKLITRIIEPTTGSVLVNGKVSALIELGAGFHPDLTGRENIYLNGSILGLSRREIDRLFDEIVAFSELERFIDTAVKHYSSGMYMRLGFAVATSVDPDILIIDEVLAVGDESFQSKCIDRIFDFKRRGKTILIVSHSLDVVERLCDQVLWLGHGVLKVQGPPEQVIRSYVYEQQKVDLAPLGEGPAPLAPASFLANPSKMPVEMGITTGRVRSVRLFDSQQIECDHFHTGDTMTVVIGVEACGTRHDIGVDLELRREDGLLVQSFKSPLLGQNGIDLTDVSGFEIQIGPMPLPSGTYDLVTTISARHGGAPGRPQSRKFIMEGDHASDDLLHLPHVWKAVAKVRRETSTSPVPITPN